LPVGISFYTFASLSYTIDVYRRKTTAVRNFIDYAFFIAFFPHLIAGPILRAKQFLPQVQNWQRPTSATVNRGIALILSGLVKKMVFADRFAIVSDAYFNNIDAHPGWLAAWSGAFAFTLQVFFDFSGYTDIARGCAKLLGFEFPINFARPALARNPIEFWQRWHITLSLWVRDYIFLPLTRSSRRRFGVYLALIITMLLVGLWHGARWNFVLWGGYCGLFMILTRLFQQKLPPALRADPMAARVLAPFKIALTFAIFVSAMALFRSRNLHDVGVVLSSMFDWQDGAGKTLLTTGTIVLFLVSVALAALEERRRFLTRLSLAPAYVQVPAYICVFLVLALFSVTDESIPFVYFQF
jgi:alginate O-acetyltransferase complex protein AlgI